MHAFASDGGHHRPLTIQGGLQAEPRSVYVFCEQPMQQSLHLYHMFVMLSQQQERKPCCQPTSATMQRKREVYSDRKHHDVAEQPDATLDGPVADAGSARWLEPQVDLAQCSTTMHNVKNQPVNPQLLKTNKLSTGAGAAMEHSLTVDVTASEMDGSRHAGRAKSTTTRQRHGLTIGRQHMGCRCMS